MNDIQQYVYQPFRPGALFRYLVDPPGMFMRYLDWDPLTDLIAVLNVDINLQEVPASRVPKLISRSELFSNREGWETVEECVSPKWMREWDDEANKGSPRIDRRDEKFAQIGALLVRGGRELLFNTETRSELIKKAANEVGFSEQWIRKVLTSYWWFGANTNALLPRTNDQGGPGASRLPVNKRKPGRRLTIELRNPGLNVGVPMTVALHDKWKEFLLRRAAEIHGKKGKVGLASQFSLPDLWIEFRDTVLVEPKKVKKKWEVVPIPLERLPRRRRFMAFGAQIFRDNVLREYFDNQADWDAVKARLGHATDHTRGGRITIFEFDGLLFNAQLLWGENVLNQVGKAVVMIGACVESTAIVGVHVTVQNESASAYRNCLFNAFVRKTELLSTMGLEKLKDGFVYGTPDECRFDRGPAKHKGLANPLIDDAKIGIRFARARRGRDKSVVEAVNKFIQEKLKHLPGFYVRTDAGHDKDAKAKQEWWARIQFEKFVELVLTFVHDWNTTRNVFDRLPDWMVKKGMWERKTPTPKAYFDKLKELSLADAAIEWSPKETYLKLIESRPVQVSEGTVSIDGARYRSGGLERLWNQHVSTRSGKHDELWINVKPHPDTNQFVVWVKDDGSTEFLAMMFAHRRTFGRNVWLIHHLRQDLGAVSKYHSENRGREAKLPALLRETIAEAEGIKRRKPVPGVKAANRQAKVAAEKLAAEQRAFELLEVEQPATWSIVIPAAATGRYNPDADERFAGDI